MEPLTGDGWTEVVRRLTAVPWRAVAIVAAVVLVAVGGCLALRSEPRAAAVVLPRAVPAPPLTPTAATVAAQAGTAGGPDAGEGTAGAAEFLVHAAGAVLRPGVYRFSEAARVIDLLTAAGGPSDGADLSGVNLAAPLADGVRVYFPHLDEEPPAEVTVVEAPTSALPAARETGVAPAWPIDLNTATAVQLQELPGVGPVTASAIVEHRDRVGPFPSVEALQDVSGIGPVKLAGIRDLVTVAR